MVPRPKRLLCVGNDAGLLRTRCAVLIKAGYEARSVTVSEVEDLLRTDKYDLVIVSAILTDAEKCHTVSAVGDGAILMLTRLTMARELLALVEARLGLPCLKG